MVADIRKAGGVILAKTNTPEFGAGGNTTNRVYGPTGNPFDPTKTSGGSSGGSAAAVALGQVPLATGSDLGGSLRTPAAFCGVVGFRPSPAWCRMSAACRRFFRSAYSGQWLVRLRTRTCCSKRRSAPDKSDPFASSDAALIPAQLTGTDLSRLRVAVSADLGLGPVDARIAELFHERVRRFLHAFRETQHRSPDFGNTTHETFEIHRAVQFVALHRQRVETRRELMDRNVVENTERGMGYSLADVAWAHVEQTNIYKRFMAFFKDVDVLICPAASVSPFPHSQLFVEEINGEKMPTYMRWLAITYAPTLALCLRRGPALRRRPLWPAVRHPGHRPQRQRRPRARGRPRAGAGAGRRQGNCASDPPLPACVHAEHGFAMTRGSG